MFPVPPADERDRGATAVEMAMLTPLLVLLIMLAVQFAMYYHAKHIANAAAQAGARVARVQAQADPQGWRALATAKADEYVNDLGPRLVDGPSSGAIGDAQTGEVGVEVRATAVRVVPFLTLPIRARAIGPVERFEADVP